MFPTKLAIKLLKILYPPFIHCDDAFLESQTFANLPIEGIEGLTNNIGLAGTR